MSVKLKVFFLLMQLAVAFSVLPDLQKCQLKDSSCLQSSAQKQVTYFVAGIPEVGTESLDPIYVDFINVELAGLKLNIRNVEVTGARNSVIDKLRIDMNKKHIQLNYHSDFVLKGKYKASGKLLVLPISGDGDIVIKPKNCQLGVDMFFDIAKNKDGKDVIDLKSYKFNYNVKDNVNFHLTNLFNGNKALSDAMITFMNSNWEILMKEFGRPVFEKPIDKIYKAIKKFLKTQPLDEIALP